VAITIEQALGPKDSKRQPKKWTEVTTGERYDFGQVIPNAQGTAILNRFKREAAARHLSIGEAVLKLIESAFAEPDQATTP